MHQNSKNNWQPQDSFGGLIFAVASKMKEDIVLALQKASLSHLSLSRIGVLNLLKERPYSQKELCFSLKLKAPTVLDFLKRLEKRALIQSKTDTEDRRKKIYSITQHGKKELSKAKNILRRQGYRVDIFFKEKKIKDKEVTRIKEILKDYLKYFS